MCLRSRSLATSIPKQNLARAGDNIVSSTDLYGGTWNLFAHTLKNQGIEARFVDPADPGNFRRATDDRTRAYYAETLPNPKLTVFPVAEVTEIGRDFGIPLIVDNTAPVLVRPLDHGAAVVVYSTTKYLGGHGNSIGGLLVDGGNFDWAAHPQRQPALNTPDPSYHGAVWTEAAKPLGPVAYAVKARVTLLRDSGAALSPSNAFLIPQGLQTLALRIRQHSENAQAVANFLLKRPEFVRVIHPSTRTGAHRERAPRYLKGGLGGLVGFELAGGEEAGRRFIYALELFYHVANIGDARSLRDSSRHHHALATNTGRAGRKRRVRRLRPSFRRYRARRRHYCRHRARTRRGPHGSRRRHDCAIAEFASVNRKHMSRSCNGRVRRTIADRSSLSAAEQAACCWRCDLSDETTLRPSPGVCPALTPGCETVVASHCAPSFIRTVENAAML